MMNFLFIHIPRTGGSSIWHRLVALATQNGTGICDIYHESKITFGSPIRASRIITSTRNRIGTMRCMFHHHTDEPILNAFEDNNVVCSTVVRDPVDRFISEVFHCRAFLRSCPATNDFLEYHIQHWGRPYVEALLQEDKDPHQLLDIASRVAFYSNYYTLYFSTLLGMCPAGAALSWRGSTALNNVRELATLVESRISVIGRFDLLQSAFSQTVRLFEIGSGAEQLDLHMNRRACEASLSGSDRRRYRRIFSLDYHLLEELGVLNDTRQSNVA